MLAVQNGNEGRKACTDILLSYTSEVDLLDNNGRTALHYASYRGFEDCVSSLLDAKAYPYQKDFLGKTPFHLAAASGHVYVLKQLIQQATVSLFDSKLLDNQRYTPLHWAAYKGKEYTLRHCFIVTYSIVFWGSFKDICFCRCFSRSLSQYFHNIVHSQFSNFNDQFCLIGAYSFTYFQVVKIVLKHY